MKKFKDLRMTIVCGVLFVGLSILSIISYLNEDKLRMIVALIAAFASLMMMITKYKNILFDDMMIIYEWQIAAMLPVVIKYEDIKDIKVKSKHIAVIDHKKKSKVYVRDAYKFLEAYHELRK